MPEVRTLIAAGLLLLAGSTTHAETPTLAPALSPSSAGAARPSLSLAPEATTRTVRPDAAAGGLVGFVQSADRLMLTGEDDSRILSFFLSEDEAKAGGEIRLSYRNAVSVLPDTALLEADLNGRAIGSFPVRAPSEDATEHLPVAAEMLRPGNNELRVRVRERHRVDCSLDAVYELWTRLDPAMSGFVPAGRLGTRFTRFADLKGIGRGPDGRTLVRLIAPKDAARLVAADAIRTLSTLALYLGRDDLAIEIADQHGAGPGIDLYLGDGDFSRQTPEARRVIAAAPAGLSVRPGDTPERATVIMRAAGRAAIDGALLTAVNSVLRDGLAAAGRGAETLFAAASGSEFTLHDTGYRTAPFDGRLFRTSFELSLPADFYPGDYGNIDLFLKAATAPGLAPGAQFLVRVDDRAVTSYRFRDPEGERLDGKRLQLPLRAFHPGVNRVELLAELPVAADKACISAQATSGKPRFLMLDETRISIPDLARMGRTPDLAALAGHAYPFASGQPFDLVVKGNDPQMLGAALTLTTRLSLAARRPLDAALMSDVAEQHPDRAALLLVAGDGKQEVKLGVTGGPAASVAAQGIDNLPTAAIAADVSSAHGGANSLLDAFQATTALSEQELSWQTRLLRLIARPLPAIAEWLDDGSAGAAAGFDRSRALIAIEQSHSPIGEASWTTITADSPEALADGIRHLSAPENWNRLSGGTAFIRRLDGALVLFAASRYALTEFTDVSAANLRRLTAAWLSDHFAIYAGLVIVCLGLFGLWLGHIVPRIGVRTDQ